MFWLSIIIFVFFIISFMCTYIIDPVALITMKRQKTDAEDIKQLSEEYVKQLGMTVDKPIKYNYVKYYNKAYTPKDCVLLGTFHEWNGVYYVDISSDLDEKLLAGVVIHETRHLIVEYLKDKHIVDLTKYTEEIALEENIYYNNLFDAGVQLLKHGK